LAISDIDGVFDAFALVLLLNFVGLLLYKRVEAFERARDVFAGFLLCLAKRSEELLLFFALALRVGPIDSKRSFMVRYPVNFVPVLVLLFTDTLHREQSILRTAVAFFANAALLAPEVAVNRITLGHFVITKTLVELHAAAVGKFAQQREYLPFQVGRRLFLRIAEVDFVLDLQPPQVRLEQI